MSTRGRNRRRRGGQSPSAAIQIYGRHPVSLVLQRAPHLVLELWSSKASDEDALYRQARELGIPVQHIKPERINAMAEQGVHQGWVAAVRPPPLITDGEWFAGLKSHPSATGSANRSAPLVLMLDHIQDPHNLGACVRSAAAAGVDAVLLPRHGSAGITAAAIKASAGGMYCVPLVSVGNTARLIDDAKAAGLWLCAADSQASIAHDQHDLKAPTLLIMGSEGQGVSRLIRERSDALVRIDMPGDMESLNVSVATGVLLFEALRQRRA